MIKIGLLILKMDKVKFGKLRRSIFIILFITAFAIALPVQFAITKGVRNAVLNFKQKLVNEYGIEISYESISPSLLSTFSVKNVEIVELGGEKLLQIDRIKASYKLIPLLKGQLQKGLGNIVVDGIRLDVTQLFTVLNKISKKSPDDKEALSEEKLKEEKKSPPLELNDLLSFIPQNIKIKNIYLSYKNASIDSTLMLRELLLSGNKRNKNITFQMNCRGSARLINLNQNLSGLLNIHGVIQEELDNSQIEIRLNNFSNGTYTLNRLNFLVTYNQNLFDIHTIQSVIPLHLAASYNIKTKDYKCELQTDKLSPSTVVNANKNKQLFNRINKLFINTESSLSGNIDTKQLLFTSAGNISLPKEVFRGGVEIDYDILANEKSLTVKKLSAEGPYCSANLDLNFIYKNLQLSGLFDLPYFMLANGNAVSTEVYFDPLDQGFMAFAPQLFLGQKALTAIQFKFMPQSDSYDFAFEAYDYSNLSEGEPGLIEFDGSYLTKSKYIQSSMSLNSLFLSSISDFGLQLTQGNLASTLKSLSSAADGFMLSGDAYFSTDFKSISYYIPYILAANTKKDNQVLMISANGNEEEIQLNQMNLVFGKYALGASALVNINYAEKEAFFSSDIVFENVPYHFTGTCLNNIISISGDYNTIVDVELNGQKEFFGNINFENLPVMAGDYSVILSTRSSFSYTKENGPNVEIASLEIDLDDSKAKVVTSPKLLLTANITKYGSQVSSITYSDLFTSMEGNADFRINFNQNKFDSAGLNLHMYAPVGKRDLLIDFNVFNPELSALSLKTIKDSLYYNAQIQTKNLDLNRFVDVKSENNFLTASVNAFGTLNHPFVSLNVENMSMQKGNKTQTINASAVLEDYELTVDSFNMSGGRSSIQDFHCNFSLDTFTGKINLLYKTGYASKYINAPLEICIQDAVKEEGKMLPQSLVATIKSKTLTGSHFKKEMPLDFTLLYSKDIISLISGPKLGLYLTYLSNGDCNLDINSPGIMTINGKGNFKDKLDFDFYNIDIDVAKVFEYINYDNWVIVENGHANGSIQITGTASEPKMNGMVMVESPAARVPIAIPVKLQAERTLVTIVNNEIYVNKNTYSVKNKPCLDADCRIVFNGFAFDYLECFFKSVNNERVHGKLSVNLFTVETDMLADLWLYYGGDDALFEIDGSINGENVNFSSNITSLAGGGEPPENPLNFVSTLDLTTGTHAAISFEPLIRTVIAPNSKFVVTCDNKARYYHIDGNVDVKSGDIAYVSRNFYIKSGNINFNTERLSNPKITLQAETREKDDKGNTVKIILNVDNQYLLSLNPRFSSTPAKSESEILSLLGQIALADSDSATDFIFAASDYAFQTAIGRKIENKLRELLNFDILSLRTNIIQNTLSTALGSTNNSLSNDLTFGNLFDNSTVYIGKYLERDLYVDAMLNFSFDKRKQAQQLSSGNLIFQPEFGMELESPLGNIRWNVAPDINALMNKQYVPSTSLTLSWKFTF